jgi:hypothetical protein
VVKKSRREIGREERGKERRSEGEEKRRKHGKV